MMLPRNFTVGFGTFCAVVIALSASFSGGPARAEISPDEACSAMNLPGEAEGFDSLNIALPAEVFLEHTFWQAVLVVHDEARLLPLHVDVDGAVQVTMPFVETPATGSQAELHIWAKDPDETVTFDCPPHVFSLKTPPVRAGAFADIILTPAPPDPLLEQIEGYAELRESIFATAQDAREGYDQADPEARRAMDALATHMLARPGALVGSENGFKPKDINFTPDGWGALPTPQPAVFRPQEDTAEIIQAFQLSDVVQIVPYDRLRQCPRNGAELTEITEILSQANLRSEEWGFDLKKKDMKQMEVYLISMGVGLYTGSAQAARTTAESLEAYIMVQDAMDDMTRGTVPTIYSKLDGSLSLHPIYENSPPRYRDVKALQITLHTKSTGFSVPQIAINYILTIAGTEGFKSLLPKKMTDSRFVPERAKKWLDGWEDDATKLTRVKTEDGKFAVPDEANFFHQFKPKPLPKKKTLREEFGLKIDEKEYRSASQFVGDDLVDKGKSKLKGLYDVEGYTKGFIKTTAKEERARREKEAKKRAGKDKPETKWYRTNPIKCEINLTDWKHIASKVVDLPLGNALEKTGEKPWDHRFEAVRAGVGAVELSFHKLPDPYKEVKIKITGLLNKDIPFLGTSIEGPDLLAAGETGFYEVSIQNAAPNEDLFFTFEADTSTPVPNGPAPVNAYFVTAPTGDCSLNYALLSVNATADFLKYSDADRTLPKAVELAPDSTDPACQEPEEDKEFHGSVWDLDNARWLETDLDWSFKCVFFTYGDKRNRFNNAPYMVDAKYCEPIFAAAHVSADRRTLKVARSEDRVYTFERVETRYSVAKDDFLRAGPFPVSPAPPMDLFRLPTEATRIAKADPWMYMRERPKDEIAVFGLQAFVHGKVAYVIDTVHQAEFSVMYRIPFVTYESGTSTDAPLSLEERNSNGPWAVPVDEGR